MYLLSTSFTFLFYKKEKYIKYSVLRNKNSYIAKK